MNLTREIAIRRVKDEDLRIDDLISYRASRRGRGRYVGQAGSRY